MYTDLLVIEAKRRYRDIQPAPEICLKHLLLYLCEDVIYNNNIAVFNRDYFRKYLFFASRSTYLWVFPGGFMCYRTDINFPGALFMYLPHRCRFSRSTLVNEQIPIRILTNRKKFPQSTPSPNSYFSKRSRLLLSLSKKIFVLYGNYGLNI